MNFREYLKEMAINKNSARISGAKAAIKQADKIEKAVDKKIKAGLANRDTYAKTYTVKLSYRDSVDVDIVYANSDDVKEILNKRYKDFDVWINANPTDDQLTVELKDK